VRVARLREAVEPRSRTGATSHREAGGGEEGGMARCSKCGNEYDKAFEVRMPDGSGGWFDSFECAVSALAPRCEHCGCTVIGHGVESDGRVFCCASCAREAGVAGVSDRVEPGAGGSAPGA
jgi:Rieske Fe-S protein